MNGPDNNGHHVYDELPISGGVGTTLLELKEKCPDVGWYVKSKEGARNGPKPQNLATFDSMG